MKPRTLISFIVFSASYLPLSMILLAQNYEFSSKIDCNCLEWPVFQSTCKLPFKNPGFSLSFFFGCLICLFISISMLLVINPKIPIHIKSAKHIPADLMNYVLPYVVSFMSIDYQETGKFIGFAIFMIWMFWITNASGQVILNPLLTVFNWQLYEITYKFSGDEKEYIGRALSKTTLNSGHVYTHATVQNIVLMKEPCSED